MYKWEIVNHSTGEISSSVRKYRNKVNATKGAISYVLDPVSSIREDHDITLIIQDRTGGVVGGLQDFPASRVLELASEPLMSKRVSLDRAAKRHPEEEPPIESYLEEV